MSTLNRVDAIGAKTIQGSLRVFDIFRFAWKILSHLVQPSSYNPAMRSIIVKQIYFTAVEIIPLFMVIAVVFGSVIIGVVIAFAAKYNLQDHIGSIIITFVMNEFAPFFTALLIALLPPQYQAFATAKLNANYTKAFDAILAMDRVSSKLIATVLIKNHLTTHQRVQILDIASQYGYKKAVIFWLKEQHRHTTDQQSKKIIMQKIGVIEKP